MTFAKFKELVNGKYPNARVFKHGEFVGNKINVGVCFDYVENSKFNNTYQYNGTYCEALNKKWEQQKKEYNEWFNSLSKEEQKPN